MTIKYTQLTGPVTEKPGIANWGDGAIKRFVEAQYQLVIDGARGTAVALVSRDYLLALRADVVASCAAIGAGDGMLDKPAAHGSRLRPDDRNPLYHGVLLGVPVYLDPRMSGSTMEMVAL